MKKYQYLSSHDPFHIEKLQLLGVTIFFNVVISEKVVTPETKHCTFQIDGNYSFNNILILKG